MRLAEPAALLAAQFFGLVLDGEKASRQELRKVQGLLSRAAAPSGSGAVTPAPFPRAQQGSSSLTSPDSSWEGPTSPLGAAAGGKATKASRARVVEFDAEGGAPVAMGGAPPGAAEERRGESARQGGTARQPASGWRAGGLGAFVPLPSSVKAHWWEQMQAFVEGQAVGAIPLEDEPPPCSPSGTAPRPPRPPSRGPGSPPRYEKAVVQRLRNSSRTHSITDDASQESDTGSSSDDAYEHVTPPAWRLPSGGGSLAAMHP